MKILCSISVSKNWISAALETNVHPYLDYNLEITCEHSFLGSNLEIISDGFNEILTAKWEKVRFIRRNSMSTAGFRYEIYATALAGRSRIALVITVLQLKRPKFVHGGRCVVLLPPSALSNTMPIPEFTPPADQIGWYQYQPTDNLCNWNECYCINETIIFHISWFGDW